METFIYNLRQELKYSRDGQPVTTASLEFNAYNMESFDEGTAFEQLVMGAFASGAKGLSADDIEKAREANKKAKKKDSKEDDLSASDVKAMLMSSQEIEMGDVARKFKEMAYKVCTLDTQGTRFTETLFKRLLREDFVEMICLYIVNFTYPSLLATEDS